MESRDATPTEPAHKGILRDETIILRWIFGYCGEAHLSDASASWPRVPQTLSPSKAESPIRHLRFLSIDIDELEEQEDTIQRFHIGVSVLDTQSLQNLMSRLSRSKNPTSHVIKSHHWVVENPNYYSQKNHTFLFGKAKCIPLSDLESRLRSLLIVQHFVLVFHGGKRELSVLQRLNINLNPLYTVDTVKAAQHPLQLSYRMSLGQLLREFEIPYLKLHTAGNDAHFVLRALLMIAVRDVERQRDGGKMPDWVPIFKAVARAPVPPRPLYIWEKAAMAVREQRRKREEERCQQQTDTDSFGVRAGAGSAEDP